jgi:UDP:flavonoid glycosyltransferase YjiC (YdhE family)
VPDNAVLTEWLPYSQSMPAADLVISHGGHGTVVRALSYGVPVLCCPAVGDMAENGARVSWSGTGLSLPRRLLSPGAVRLAVRRILSDAGYRRRAREIQAWSEAHDGAARAANLVEQAAESAPRTRSSARAL